MVNLKNKRAFWPQEEIHEGEAPGVAEEAQEVEEGEDHVQEGLEDRNVVIYQFNLIADKNDSDVQMMEKQDGLERWKQHKNENISKKSDWVVVIWIPLY